MSDETSVDVPEQPQAPKKPAAKRRSPRKAPGATAYRYVGPGSRFVNGKIVRYGDIAVFDGVPSHEWEKA